MRASSTLGEVLAACTAEHAWDVPPDRVVALASRIDSHQLARSVRHHRVAGCVWLTLGRTGLLDDVATAALRQAYDGALVRHLTTMSELEQVATVLDSACLPWAVLKGPVLTGAVYSRADLRSYNDLDVLVRSQDLDQAVDLLETAGCFLLDANWPMLAALVPGELHLSLPHGGLLDLHWNVAYERTVRSSLQVSTEQILARSSRMNVSGLSVPALDPLDMLVHVALHACVSGGDRLVWLKDIEQCLNRWRPAWASVTDRAREWATGVSLGVMLGRARSTLGVDVPDRVLAELVPRSAWRSVLRATDTIWPVERALPGGSPARLAARASRSDVDATRRETGRRMRAWARGGFQGTPRARAADMDPSNPESALHRAGGPKDRSAFFAAIRQETLGVRR